MYFLLIPLFAFLLGGCTGSGPLNEICLQTADGGIVCYKYDPNDPWSYQTVDASVLPPVDDPKDAGVVLDASVGAVITAVLQQQGDWEASGYATWKHVSGIEYEGEKDMTLARKFPETDPCKVTEGYFDCGAYSVACPPTADVVSDFVRGVDDSGGLYRLNGIVLPSGAEIVGREFRCIYRAKGVKLVLGSVK